MKKVWTGFLVSILPNLMLAQNQISPDGQWVVNYELVDSVNAEIYIARLDGSDKRFLTSNPLSDYNPEWMTDGNEVVFYRLNKSKSSSNICSVNIETLEEKILVTSDFYIADPSISSDGILSFTSNEDGDHEIFISGSDYSSQQLTFNESNDWTPSWSPDGKEIVFVSDRSGHFEIYKMTCNGKDTKQLTEVKRECYGPSWSPDGQWISYFSRKSSSDKFDLFIVSSEGDVSLALTSTEDWNEYVLGWSPDAKRIIYDCEEHKGICSIDIETKRTNILTLRKTRK